MSRHTYLKGMVNDAFEDIDIDNEYQQNQDNGDFTEEEIEIIEGIEYEFSKQFDFEVISEYLINENFNEDSVKKLLQQVIEINIPFVGKVDLKKTAEIYYKHYFDKKLTIEELQGLAKKYDEKQEKKKNNNNNLLLTNKNNSKGQQQDQQQQQQPHLGRKNSTNNSNSNIRTRKESHDIKKELLLEKQLSREHHSIKIEQFQQETDKSQYNKIYEPVDYKYKISEKESEHNQINLVTVGHVDSGKSTLVGHLRHQLNDIDKRQMHKLDKQSSEQNKQSFKYAYGQDEYQDEISRGVTVDVGFKTVCTGKNEINFLDSPGHRDFVPNMISGTAQADYALLVIDSGPNSFEAGFGPGGQTKEHAYLIKAFGVDKVIVAVNKMDLHQWDKDRYQEVVTRVFEYLYELGFDKKQIKSIPIGAFQGQNLIEKYKGKEAQWYTGPCLIELLESLQPPKRTFQKPLRLNVYTACTKKNINGLCISGKVEGGLIQKNDKIVIQPHGIIAQVKDLSMNFKKITVGKSGDNIEAQIQLKEENQERFVNTGNVVCLMKQAIPVTKQVIIEFVAFDLIYPILKGSEVMVYINTARVDGFLYKINKLIDKNNGVCLKKNPKCIKSHECAEINLKFNEDMNAEIYANYKIYGRVILRDNKHTIGVGTIKEIL